jgi:hypothetical protein
VISGITIIVTCLFLVFILLNASNESNNVPSLGYQQAIAQKTATTIPSFITYRNSTYGISLQYPSDWIYRGSANTSTIGGNNAGQIQPIVAFAPQDRRIHALVIIGTINLPPVFRSIQLNNMSSLASVVIDNIKQYTPGFRLIESNGTSVKTGAANVGNATITNTSSTTVPGLKLVYTADGPIHKTMAVYAIKGDKAYFINYLTETESIYATDLPLAQKMIDSFQIYQPTSSTLIGGGLRFFIKLSNMTLSQQMLQTPAMGNASNTSTSNATKKVTVNVHLHGGTNSTISTLPVTAVVPKSAKPQDMQLCAQIGSNQPSCKPLVSAAGNGPIPNLNK